MKKIYFSSNLVFLRKKRGVNQLEIIDSIGFKRSTWSGYETGNSFPKLEDFLKISEYFDIKTDDLLFTDLPNVHLNEIDKDGKNSENVHPNVHASVHLKSDLGVKNDSSGSSSEAIAEYGNANVLIDVLTTAVKGLERANAQQERIIAKLEEENARLQSKIPVIGKPVAKPKARSA